MNRTLSRVIRSALVLGVGTAGLSAAFVATGAEKALCSISCATDAAQTRSTDAPGSEIAETTTFSQRTSGTMTDLLAKAKEIPIVCILPDTSTAERGKGNLDNLLKQTQETVETENGYALRFAASDAHMVLDYVTSERKCCAFFIFEMRFEPGAGPLWLTISGPPQAKLLMREFLDLPKN